MCRKLENGMSGYQSQILTGNDPYRSQQFSPRIFERDYVEGVLGIHLPLNESAPYSDQYRQQIIEEQLQLEGFFKDFKKLGGQMKDAALGLRFVFEEPSRIKEFVELIISEVNETYDKFMNWAGKLLKILKKIAKSYANKAMQAIGEFIQKIKDALQKVWDKTESLDGWKKALFAIFASVSIRYVWDQITDSGADEQTDEEKAAEIMAALGASDEEIAKLGESIEYTSPSLVTALYSTDSDERLDEFIKSLKKLGKKAKDTFGKAKKDSKKVSDQLDKNKAGKKVKKAAKKKADELKDDAKEKAKEALSGSDDDSDSGDDENEAKEAAKKETEAFLKPLKKLAKKMGKGFAKNLAVDAALGAMTGGVATAFKFMSKAFSGIKYVFSVVGGPLSKFVGQIKDQKAEEKEAKAGKDDPTDASTQKEAYLRAYVGEIIRAESP